MSALLVLNLVVAAFVGGFVFGRRRKPVTSASSQQPPAVPPTAHVPPAPRVPHPDPLRIEPYVPVVPWPAPRVVTRTIYKHTTAIQRVERVRMVPRHATPEEERTSVYRYYNVGDELLYVGVTADPVSRANQHRGDQPWWPEVARHETVEYPHRWQALAVEQSAISHERPRYNRQPGGLSDAHVDGGRHPLPVFFPLPQRKALAS